MRLAEETRVKLYIVSTWMVMSGSSNKPLFDISHGSFSCSLHSMFCSEYQVRGKVTEDLLIFCQKSLYRWLNCTLYYICCSSVSVFFPQKTSTCSRTLDVACSWKQTDCKASTVWEKGMKCKKANMFLLSFFLTCYISGLHWLLMAHKVE